MKFDPEAWVFARPRLGELETVLLSPSKQSPKSLVVLCHGFGAPGTDLVNLFDDLLYYLPEDSPPFAMLFPAGPVDLEDQGMPGGRAWWRLNMAKLMQMAATNSFDQMRDVEPPEINDVRNQLVNCIQATREKLRADHALEGELPVVLGGFSQGAMLSVDTLLRGNLENVSGLFVYSGALICESLWRNNASAVRGLSFVQSHGTQDTVLPYDTGLWLNELLTDIGMQGGMLRFDGPHTIPTEAIMQSAKLLHTINMSASR
jgi:phospholipase/carboxylesterase